MPSPISREGMALCHADLSWRFVMAICHGGLSRRFVVAIQSVSGHRAICSLSDIYIYPIIIIIKPRWLLLLLPLLPSPSPIDPDPAIDTDPDRSRSRSATHGGRLFCHEPCTASRSIPIPIIICQVGPQGQLYNFVQQWPPDAWHFLACLHHCQDLGHP